ncbi:MAG: SDR family oxidoreductase [Desulfomonile sp.]|nr:SDR family oxidoreductase [Desulfomonile sp.]
MKLKNKVAIVTGASKGIGKGIAVRYAQEGASVVLASRSMDLLTAIVGEIRGAGGSALALTLDVRSPDSVESVVRRTVGEYGKLDIMVNNAGISMAHPSEDLDPADWERALQTDLSGIFYGCRSAARQMISQGTGGSIINVTSVYGIVAAPMRAAYCASKAGANMLTKVLASEWANKKIRVNALAPGYIRTDLVQGLIDRGILPLSAIEKRTPQGRIGEISDLLAVAVLLAGDEAPFMTGSIVTVDGGWSAYGYL